MSELKIFPTREKRPLTPNGLYDARPMSEWRGDESDQWGAPCGEANGFFVMDVDAQHGGLEEAAKHDWGTTLKIATPSGGHHLYYRYDASTCGTIRNNVAVLKGIDVRANGGYVVLYDTPEMSQVADAPAWLLEMLKRPEKRLADLSAGEDEVGEGGRNHYITRAAGRLQRAGVLTLASLEEINERKCNPPLEAEEIRSIFESVSRYAPDSTPEDDPIPKEKIVWASTLISGMLEYLRDKGRVSGDPTGIEELDALLGGGKRLGELTVTLAEAKSGKNTLWHYLQRIQLDKGVQVGYASRELSPESEVLPNLLTLALGRNIYKTDAITEEELVQCMLNWKLAFAPGYGAFSGTELWDWMDECRAHGVFRFYIDHLHYCLPNSEDYQQTAEFARKLKTYTKSHSVHIDLIIQPKNIDPFAGELDIHSLRGGANLGQVLDNLITMQRQRDENGELIDVTKVTLKRARSKMAKPGHFFIQYDKDLMTFDVVTKEEAAAAKPSEMREQRYEEPMEDVPVADRGRSGIQPRKESVFNGAATAALMVKRIKLGGNKV